MSLSTLVEPKETICGICRGQAVIECTLCSGDGTRDWESAVMARIEMVDATDARTPERRNAIRALLALHDSEDSPCVCPQCNGDAIQLCECQKP